MEVLQNHRLLLLVAACDAAYKKHEKFQLLTGASEPLKVCFQLTYPGKNSVAFRILIDPKSVCCWGAGRRHITIYDLQLLSHPTEQTLLAKVYNNYWGVSGVISSRAGQE